MATKPVHTFALSWGANEHRNSSEGVYAIDIGAPCNSDLFACVSGVLHSYSSSAWWWAGDQAFYIQGDDGKFYVYAHGNSKIADGRVQEGQVVGKSGTRGNSTGCHLHFSVCDNLTDVGYGGNRSQDETTPFWNNAKEPGGTPLPPSTNTGQGTGNHTPQPTYPPKPVGDVITLVPKHLVFRKGNADVYSLEINIFKPTATGFQVTESSFARWGFEYDNVILKNKYGNWLHWVHLPTTKKIGKDSPMNIEWLVELKQTSVSHSLLGKLPQATKIELLMLKEDQVGLKAELKKNAGWTATGDTLTGNVKTSQGQLKHNDNMYTKTSHAGNNISYIPTLFSSEK